MVVKSVLPISKLVCITIKVGWSIYFKRKVPHSVWQYCNEVVGNCNEVAKSARLQI